MKSDLPELFSKKERMLVERFRSESLSIVGDAIESFEPFPDGDNDFHQRLWLEILFTEPFEEWQKDSIVFYEKLKEISEEYNAILDDYDEIIEESSDVARRYFSNPEDNLDKLQEISDALKETAIEPSFALLAETQKELETVKTRIQEVSFT